METVTEFFKALNESTSDYDVLIDQLVNNDMDSDDEIAKFVASETSLDKNKIKKFVKKYRDDFLTDKGGITGWKSDKLQAFVKKNL